MYLDEKGEKVTTTKIRTLKSNQKEHKKSVSF
jgi:hypothetical protein